MKTLYEIAQKWMSDNWVGNLMYQERVNRLKTLLEQVYRKGYDDCYKEEVEIDDNKRLTRSKHEQELP